VARAAISGRLTWQLATVLETIDETNNAKSIVLRCPDWSGHLAGQHVDIRLTAEDGYQAQRSYSISSAPDEPLTITVVRLDDGEVSPFLTGELRTGDEIEIRGPIGGYFVWTQRSGGPLMLIGGGSGVAPLRAIFRHHASGAGEVPIRLLYSARSMDEVLFRAELFGSSDVRFALTRAWPPDWSGHRGRIDREFLEREGFTARETPLVYVCGPTPFVETMSDSLVALGHAPERIRTERFGPTGGS
jgi:ferredoxin-NADP reductase